LDDLSPPLVAAVKAQLTQPSLGFPEDAAQAQFIPVNSGAHQKIDRCRLPVSQ